MESLQVGMSAMQVRAWARQQGVESWLDLPARVLQGHLKGAWFWVYRNKSLTLEQILTLPTARGAHEASDERMPRELQEAALRLLEEQAGLMAEGLSDESAHLAALTPPLDHRLGGLWERLWSARAALRAQVMPRAYRLMGPVEMSLVDDPPQVVYREQIQGGCRGQGSGSGSGSDEEEGGGGYWPEVRVDLQPADGGPVLRCRCPKRPEARCVVGLSALDACLNVLGDSRQPEMRDRISRLVSEPRWNRALDALDRLLQQAAPEGAERPDEEALGWRLRAQPGKPLELEPVRCRPLRGGEGLRSWKIEVEELLRDPQLCSLPTDQEVLAQLYPAPEVAARSQPRALWQALVHRAVSRLVGHPRVLLNRGSEPVRVVEGQLALRWEQEDPLSSIELQPSIDGQILPVPELLALLESQLAGGLLVQTDEEARLCRVVRIEPGTVALLERLLSRGSSFPPEAAEALIARREAFERLLPVQLAAPLRGVAIDGDHRPVLRLQALEGEVLRLEVRVRPLPEGGSFPPGEGPRELYGERRGQRVYVARDLSAEPAQVRSALAPLGLPAPDEGTAARWTVADPHAALALMEAIDAGGWQTEWAGPPRHLTAPASAKGLSLSVGSRRDWFGLKGSLMVGRLEVPLERLLQAVWEGRPFLVIEGGGWLRLEEDFRDRLAQAAAVIFPGKRGLEISPLHAPTLQGLAALGAEIGAPKAWSALLERVQVAQDLDPAPPDGLTATLRDYQRAGFVWMARLAAWGAGACLADDMGLGKTVQSLALLAHRAAQGPALVVAPTSVCFNWLREAGRLAPGLQMLRHQGPERQARLADLRAGQVLVVSYGLLTRDIEALAGVVFATVIFDEAQALKNPSARRTRAARQLQAGFGLALTGTPIENHVGELWSLFSVVSPGLLGAWDRFRDRFATPIGQGDAGRQADLAALLRPFLLRRLKAQVAAELPDRTEVVVPVQLSEAERLLYDRVRLASLAALTDPDRVSEQERRFQVLAAITRLRQIACHPLLYDPALTDMPSAKLARLREIVAELRSEGHRALLFSQFTRHLQIARDALAADGATYCYLDGSTPDARRQREIERFQAGEGDLFFISLKAGGAGITLTAANYVIHLDPWWNPAVEDQATDRAHRIGQRMPVTVYRLVSHGTIEASILELHAEKRKIVERLLDGAGQAANLSADALVGLIQESSRTLLLEDNDTDDLEGEGEGDDVPEEGT